MCGIAGLAGCGDPAALERMIDLLRHRGPDDGGSWSATGSDGRYLGLANRRLAIRDLSPAGHMPMSSEDGRLHLTYNGEIYNADALRAELQGRGLRFRSTSDTEVLLRLLEVDGPEAVSRVEGMFAFAAVDLDGGRLGSGLRGPAVLLGRDRFGIKPLYLADVGEGIAFASEVKSLLALEELSAAVDAGALVRYLTLLWVPEPDTLFRGVRRLPAAHLGLWEGGVFREWPYWKLAVPGRGSVSALDEHEAAEEVWSRLRAGVSRQLVSDVPLGAFLSAGLDSSAIVAAMAESASGPVRTFTVTFPEEHRRGETTLDDPRVARRLAQHFGTRHEEIVAEPDVAALLPQLVWHMDDPVADPAILSAYLVTRAASESVTVLLSGVGGDEVFGGYRKYAAARLGAWYRRIPGPLRRGLLEPALRALPSLRGTPFMGHVRLAKKMGRSASLPPEEAFLRNATVMDRDAIASLLTDEAAEVAGLDQDPFAEHRRRFSEVEGADLLNRLMYVDIHTFMVSLNLDYNDKMSMASSVEVRVPFLDKELVEFSFRELHPNLKLDGEFRPVTKRVLRTALRGRVPDEVLRQPKAGFGAPHDHWLAHDLREMVDDLLTPDRVRSRGWFRPEAVRAVVERHRAGDAGAAYPLWQLLTLELWQEAFVDGAGGGFPVREPRVAGAGVS